MKKIVVFIIILFSLISLVNAQNNFLNGELNISSMFVSNISGNSGLILKSETDNSTIFLGNGMIGIGTINPIRLLHIQNNVDGVGSIRFTNLNSTNGGFNIRLDKLGGIELRNRENEKLSLWTNNEERVIVRKGGKTIFNGNVDILGTLGGGSPLQVAGGLTLVNGSGVFEENVIIKGFLSGTSLIKATQGFNITFDEDALSQVVINNLNNGTRASSRITFVNDIGARFTVGILSSNSGITNPNSAFMSNSGTGPMSFSMSNPNPNNYIWRILNATNLSNIIIDTLMVLKPDGNLRVNNTISVPNLNVSGNAKIEDNLIINGGLTISGQFLGLNDGNITSDFGIVGDLLVGGDGIIRGDLTVEGDLLGGSPLKVAGGFRLLNGTANFSENVIIIGNLSGGSPLNVVGGLNVLNGRTILSQDIEISGTDRGLILPTRNGSKYILTVDNRGNLVTTKIASSPEVTFEERQLLITQEESKLISTGSLADQALLDEVATLKTQGEDYELRIKELENLLNITQKKINVVLPTVYECVSRPDPEISPRECPGGLSGGAGTRCYATIFKQLGPWKTCSEGWVVI